MSDSTGNRWDDWPRAAEIRVDPDSVWVRLVDGRELRMPFAWFGFLDGRTRAELEDVEISAFGSSMWWETIDEGVSVPSLLGLPENPPPDPNLRSYTVDYAWHGTGWGARVRDTHLGSLAATLAATQRAVRSNLARYHGVRSLRRIGIEVIDVVHEEAAAATR